MIPPAGDQWMGILGGGQLARMLAQAGAELGLRIAVLAGAADDPAAQVAERRFFGSLEDPAALETFFRECSVVIFENEFASCEQLRRAAAGREIQFLPSLDAIYQTQDKLRQKEAARRAGAPISVFVELDLSKSDSAVFRQARDSFPSGFVLKWSQLGYDGYGTWISPDRIDSKSEADAFKFLARAREKKVPVFAEEKISFRRELSIIGVRSITGEFAHYPLVVSQQENGVCRKVLGPASQFGVKLEAEAARHAQQVAQTLGLVGVFAIEWFETQEGRLVMNEIAPRVHNTGHFTQNGAQTSQFENHWRAVLGWPLGSTECSASFAMLNLLGPPHADERHARAPLPTSEAHVHWYGKAEARARRKLGHLNAFSQAAGEAEKLAVRLEQIEKSWREGRHNG